MEETMQGREEPQKTLSFHCKSLQEGLSKELIQGRLIWLEAYKNKMPKLSPNMHVKQEVLKKRSMPIYKHNV